LKKRLDKFTKQLLAKKRLLMLQNAGD
jgi:hypothetical protein